jgi:hypothetical protein
MIFMRVGTLLSIIIDAGVRWATAFGMLVLMVETDARVASFGCSGRACGEVFGGRSTRAIRDSSQPGASQFIGDRAGREVLEELGRSADSARFCSRRSVRSLKSLPARCGGTRCHSSCTSCRSLFRQGASQFDMRHNRRRPKRVVSVWRDSTACAMTSASQFRQLSRGLGQDRCRLPAVLLDRCGPARVSTLRIAQAPPRCLFFFWVVPI